MVGGERSEARRGEVRQGGRRGKEMSVEVSPSQIDTASCTRFLGLLSGSSVFRSNKEAVVTAPREFKFHAERALGLTSRTSQIQETGIPPSIPQYQTRDNGTSMMYDTSAEPR